MQAIGVISLISFVDFIDYISLEFVIFGKVWHLFCVFPFLFSIKVLLKKEIVFSNWIFLGKLFFGYCALESASYYKKYLISISVNIFLERHDLPFLVATWSFTMFSIYINDMLRLMTSLISNAISFLYSAYGIRWSTFGSG